MGTVPHVFLVVEEKTQKPLTYSLAAFQRPSVGLYEPATPPVECASLSLIVTLTITLTWPEPLLFPHRNPNLSLSLMPSLSAIASVSTI